MGVWSSGRRRSTANAFEKSHVGSNPTAPSNYKITIMEPIFLNLILEENCKTIGNFDDKLLVKSKWYRPILTDNYSFNIAAERPDLNIKH